MKNDCHCEWEAGISVAVIIDTLVISLWWWALHRYPPHPIEFGDFSVKIVESRSSL